MIPIWVAIIAAIPPTIASLLSLFLNLRNRKSITEIHLSLNSRLDELLTAAHAQGRQAERDDQKNSSTP